MPPSANGGIGPAAAVFDARPSDEGTSHLGPVCHRGLQLEERWHLHHIVWRVYGGSDALYNRRLLHANCHRQVHHQGLPAEQAASRERRP